MKLPFTIALFCLVSGSFFTSGRPQSFTAQTNCNDLRPQLNEGKRQLQKNDFQRAIHTLSRAYEACPTNSAAGIELAKAQIAAREFPKAERTAKQVLENDPNSEPAQFLLAYSYFMQERFSDTGNLLRDLLAAHPENAAAHKLMGLTLFFYKEYSSAELELSIALQKNPNDREALYYMGRIYVSQSNVKPAIEIFQRLLAQDPDDYKSADNLALCYEGIGRTADAEAMFKNAQEAARKKKIAYDWAYSNLAEMLIQQNRSAEAVPVASEALAINSQSARNNYLMGAALAAQGEPDKALAYLEKSVAIDSNFPEPHKTLGQVYQKLHQPEKAEHEFKLFAETKARRPAKQQ